MKYTLDENILKDTLGIDCSISKERGNELVLKDVDLYNNIDKVLATKNLTYILLNLSNAPIQEEVLIKLAEVKTLYKLELSFVDSDIAEIPEFVFSITSLTELSINNIKATALSSKISNLKRLEILQVYGTNIKSLPTSIGELTKLKELDMPSNCITYIPSTIGKLTELEEIVLLGNELSDIPQSMCNLKKLKTLHISYNKLALSNK